MSNWRKLVIGSVAVMTLGVGIAMVAQASGRSPSGVVDISGPCDEAEHANDPRCAGTTVPAGAGDDGAAGPRDGGLRFNFDISGPCDEAEHANDPRCTGVGRVDDNSGAGDGNDDREDNSGPGSHGDRDDNSGSGHGGDDGEDNSGPGNGEGD